jgi:hypothetical protein
MKKKSIKDQLKDGIKIGLVGGGLIGVILYSFMPPKYCECEELARDAWLHTVGGEYSETDFNDWGDLEDCADKIIEFMDYDMDADKMNIEYIRDFSKQMCENRCYVVPYGRDEGKKYCLDD